MTRTLLSTMLAAAFVATTACTDSPSAPTPPPSTTTPVSALSIIAATTSGPAFQLTASATFTDGTTQDVTSRSTWESSNPSLATVSSGMVTVLGSGEVEVRATFQSMSASMRVLVATVPVTAVDISGGGTRSQFQLTATATLADGSRQDVTRSGTWATSNAQIATVSPTGLVGVVSTGEVDISVAYRGVTATRHFAVTTDRMFRLTGSVREAGAGGRPVANASVRVLGQSAMALTDAAGAFAFAQLPPGRQLIEVSKEGYRVWESDLMLDADKSIVVELTPTTTTTGVSHGESGR